VPLRSTSDLRPDFGMSEETTTVPDEPSEDAAPNGRRRRSIVIGLVVVAAVAGGAIAWVLFGRASSDKPQVVPIAPVGLSASGLRALSAVVPQPIYWAGPRKGYLYELKRTSDGSVYVRYLPPGVSVGESGDGYLVVATYPSADALSALQKSANGQGISIPGGGLAVVNPKTQKSVYVALPDEDYEAEVFDARLAGALALVKAGLVRPVGIR